MASLHVDATREPVDAPRWTQLRSVLVLVPRTGVTPRVLARIGMLPIAHGATVALVHVRSRFSTADGDALLADAAARLAPLLPATVKVDRVLASGPFVGAIAGQAHAMRAQLLVMTPTDRALRSFVLGSTVSRFVRSAMCPVLIVRTEASAAYRRPVLAVDLDDTARQMLAFASHVLGEPPPPIMLLHVADAPLQGFISPSSREDTMRAYRERCRQQGERALVDWLAEIGVSEGRYARTIEVGEPRDMIQAATVTLRADILMLGMHTRSIVGRALLGSVTVDVLARIRCDALVVPPRQPGVVASPAE